MRKWIALGPGIEIFGVTLVFAATNLKCSSIGWSAGKSSWPVITGTIGLGGDAVELDAAAFALDDVEPVEHAHEIEVPPGAAELAVGHRLEADRSPAS